MFSKVAGPTAGTADTEVLVGAAAISIPTRHTFVTIKQVRVGFGHVVDAKSPCAVFELKITGVNGPFRWVIGSGAGGAATTKPTPPDIINCNIHVPGGAGVSAYVTFADAAADVTVTIRYVSGRTGKMTYSDMPALTASANADTRTSLGSITTIPGNWTLDKIRVGLGQVVDAKAATAKIEITGGGLPADELQFGFGSGSSGATNSGHLPAEEQEIGIACAGNTALTVYVTAADAAVESGFSIQYS